jgi:hypothetical protein
LINKTSKTPYSDEKVRAYKSLESYKYYESKYVREMYVKSCHEVKLIMSIVHRANKRQFSELLYPSDIANAMLDKVNVVLMFEPILFTIRATQKLSKYWFDFNLDKSCWINSAFSN